MYPVCIVQSHRTPKQCPNCVNTAVPKEPRILNNFCLDGIHVAVKKYIIVFTRRIVDTLFIESSHVSQYNVCVPVDC